MKRAVITGLGAITPIGNNVNEFWKNLVAGKSGAAPITKFDTTNHKTKFACEVKNFSPLDYFEKPEARKMDLYTQYTLAAADECIKDSGIDIKQCNLSRIGVLIASGIGGIKTFEDEMLGYFENNKIPRFSPFFITKMIANMATGYLTMKYGFNGISYCVVSACASSNNAIANALDIIRLGRADVVIVGGSEAAITPSAIGGFNATKALSTLNDFPEKASRPFDKQRDGFVMGEGAAILMVEELEHALNRGAKIYCELAGYGAASDAYHITAPHPEGLGAILAMEGALKDAQMKPEDISYINAHATATPAGDISECKAIEKIFGNVIDNLHISATKSMTGHLLGAAGAIEAIACIKSIEEGIIPPTINLDELDPQINPKLNLTPHKSIKKEVKAALNNTFGFGGHTSSTLFRKYE